MRILAACSLGGAGHLGPLLPFLEAARRRGDDVMVAGPPALRQMVAGAGFPFVAGDEPTEAQVAPIRELLPIVPRDEAVILGNRELFGRLAARAMLPAMARICADWSPRIVLRDPCEYASAAVAHGQGIQTAQVAISLAEAEWGSIEAAGPALEELRQGLTGEVRRSTYLTRFPQSLDPSPFPATVRVQPPPAAAPPPLPDWWNGSRAPFVYMTFGTVLGHMSIAGDVFRAAVEAVGGVPARVLLTVGRQFDPTSLGPVPANVHVSAWVDQAAVLPHAEVVVCHGGSGTAYGALAAGVPLVLVPVFADQFENARRIAGARAGITVADPSDIGQAIATVLGDPSFQKTARSVAAESCTSRTVDEALEDLVGGLDPG